MTRAEQPFILESLQRGIEGADRVVTPRSTGQVATDRQPVSLVVQAGDREHGDEFERAERGSGH